MVLSFLPLTCVSATDRLPRENQLVFRNEAGQVADVRTLSDWQRRREDAIRGFLAIAGPLPGPDKRVALDVKVEEEVDKGTYLQRRITYQSEPGNRVPAWFCVPKAALQTNDGRAFPAVLCPHPTNNSAGAGVVVGLGNTTNRSYGSELAERGYVVLAPWYPHLAGYAPDLAGLGYASGTMKAVWDNMRGLDLLESLPYVRREGFGTIGHSLGGHNSIFTAVMDPRVVVVATSCGFDSFLDYYDAVPAVWLPGKAWAQERYMPRMAGYAGRLEEIPFDFYELIAALAPRRVFVSAPTRDANFRWKSVDRIAAAARPVFALHGVPDNLRIEHPDCEHDFPNEMRQAAYAIFDAVLKGGAPDTPARRDK